eukprot:155568-Chlamydomonas_euryale.AAC.1
MVFQRPGGEQDALQPPLDRFFSERSQSARPALAERVCELTTVVRGSQKPVRGRARPIKRAPAVRGRTGSSTSASAVRGRTASAWPRPSARRTPSAASGSARARRASLRRSHPSSCPDAGAWLGPVWESVSWEVWGVVGSRWGWRGGASPCRLRPSSYPGAGACPGHIWAGDEGKACV